MYCLRGAGLACIAASLLIPFYDVINSRRTRNTFTIRIRIYRCTLPICGIALARALIHSFLAKTRPRCAHERRTHIHVMCSVRSRTLRAASSFPGSAPRAFRMNNSRETAGMYLHFIVQFPKNLHITHRWNYGLNDVSNYLQPVRTGERKCVTRARISIAR